MPQIGERISAVMSEVKCPGCKKHVTPTLPDTTTEPTTEGKRWSFVWRPPTGEVCPECDFPLARYVRRLRWIRIFRLGVALLTISFLVYFFTRNAEAGTWLRSAVLAVAGAGLVAFLVGVVGLIVGGRRDAPGAGT